MTPQATPLSFPGCTAQRLDVLASKSGERDLSDLCSVSSIILSNILSSTHHQINCSLPGVSPTSETHYDNPARSAFYWANLEPNTTAAISVVCEDR